MPHHLPMAQPEPSPQDAPPIFPRIAVVGLGLVGGSLAMAARRRWPTGLVIGVDRKEVVERAMLLHAIDVGADDLGMAGDADLIVLATPVSRICDLLRAGLAEFVSREAVVTDVGSAKRGIADAARDLPRHLHFVGGHPLAGAAVSGIDHARAELFEGRPWLLCPGDDRALHRVDEFVAALGARPRVMDPGEHDSLVAFLSHLPQLTASALMSVVGERLGQDGLALSGRGLQDTTRLASSPPDIWSDVCASNSAPIALALDDLIARLQALRANLQDRETIERVFESARRWKERMPPQ